MRAATGSQWSSMSSGVTCALFGWLNTRRAAAFWINCSGFTTQAGETTLCARVCVCVCAHVCVFVITCVCVFSHPLSVVPFIFCTYLIIYSVKNKEICLCVREWGGLYSLNK